MVFLAITTAGLQKAIKCIGDTKNFVWCGSNAISDTDFSALKSSGVTRFDYSLDGESFEVIAGAIETIKEHHPSEIIWVETA